jgi:hypothetical protein
VTEYQPSCFASYIRPFSCSKNYTRSATMVCIWPTRMRTHAYSTASLCSMSVVRMKCSFEISALRASSYQA